MAKAARFREAGLRRRKAVRDPRHRFILLCEGRNSEPLYFSALGRFLNGVVIEIEKGMGTPDAIASAAVERKKMLGRAWYERKDEIWAVFDRDVHEHHDAAVVKCRDNGIGVARSNPCFEVWLILHVEDYHRPDGRDKVFRKVCKLWPKYQEGKGRNFDFDALLSHLDKAESRAAAQLALREKEGNPHGAPSTTVHELIHAVRSKIQS